MFRPVLLALPIALVLPSAHAQDAAAGGVAFMQCADCHSTAGNDGVGPGLKDILGRRAGAKAGFLYSPAMAKSGLTWDAKTLDAFLADPKEKVPGTTMAFPGVDDAKDRADLIAYLRTLK